MFRYCLRIWNWPVTTNAISRPISPYVSLTVRLSHWGPQDVCSWCPQQEFSRIPVCWRYVYSNWWYIYPNYLNRFLVCVSANYPTLSQQTNHVSSVVSGIGSGIISFLLLFHYIFRGDYSDEEGKKIRIAGRHFMLSIIFLTSLLALEGLIFCMVENWTYLDALCELCCRIKSRGNSSLIIY